LTINDFGVKMMYGI